MSEQYRGRHEAPELDPIEEIWLAVSAIEYDLHSEIGDHNPNERLTLQWQDGTGSHVREFSYLYAEYEDGQAGEYFPQFVKIDTDTRMGNTKTQEGFQLWHDGKVWYQPPDGTAPWQGDERVERRMYAELEWFLDMKRQHRAWFKVYDKQDPAQS